MGNKKKLKNFSFPIQMGRQNIRRTDRRRGERSILAYSQATINRLRRQGRRFVVQDLTYNIGMREFTRRVQQIASPIQTLFRQRVERRRAYDTTIQQIASPIQTLFRQRVQRISRGRDAFRNLLRGRQRTLGQFLNTRDTGISALYNQLRDITNLRGEWIVVDSQNRQVVRFNASASALMKTYFYHIDSPYTIFRDYYGKGTGYRGTFYIRPFTYTAVEDLPNTNFYDQFFADNESTDCVIVPIEEKLYEKIDKWSGRHQELKDKKKDKNGDEKKEMKNLTSKLCKQRQRLRVCEKYREISKECNGLNTQQIQEFANEIHFSIHLFVPYLNLDEIWVGNKGASDKIDLYNTRFNHLDKFNHFFLQKKSGRNNEMNYIEVGSREELLEKFNEFKELNQINQYFRNQNGIASFTCNQNTKYSFRGNELYREFSQKLNKYVWYIHHDDEDNKSWANNMTGVMGCIDFMNINEYRKIKEEGGFLSNELQSVDRKNSYFNYDMCGKYKEGLAGKFLHSGAMPNVDKPEYLEHLKHYRMMGKSSNFYLTYSIYDIVITHPKLKFYNDKLKIFKDYMIVSDDMLQLLDEYNTGYKVAQYKVFSRTQEDIFNLMKSVEELEEMRDNGEIDERDDDEENPFYISPTNAFFNDGHSIKDENGCALYSKFVGKLMTISENFKFNICGNENYCAVVNDLLTSHNSLTTARYNDYDQDITITTPKKIHHTLTQIAGSITQKQLLSVLQQLLVMDETKIVRVVGDGIYTLPHEYEVLTNCGFRVKHEEKDFKLGNAGGTCFTSQIPHDWLNFFRPSADMNFNGVAQHIIPNTHLRYEELVIKEYGEFTDLYKTDNIPHLYCNPLFINGLGGSGKTSWVMKKFLEDNRIKEHEVLFLSPTHNLANEVRLEYYEDNGEKKGYDVCYTRHKVSGEMAKNHIDKFQYLIEKEYIRKGRRVMILDEFPQMSSKILKQFINQYYKQFQIILIGDIGFREEEGKSFPFNYQVGENISDLSNYIYPNKLNVINFNEDYRAKDDRLKQLKRIVRDTIKNYEIHNPYVDLWEKRRQQFLPILNILSQFPELHTISIDDIDKHFVLNEERTDIVVSGYNDISSSNKGKRKRFLNRLSGGEYKRYKNNDTTEYKTLRKDERKPKNHTETYCMSCNSIQGITIKAPNRVFVDLEFSTSMFSLQHFFVAISRVEYIDQITIVKK